MKPIEHDKATEASLVKQRDELVAALEQLTSAAEMFPEELSKEHYAVTHANAALAKVKGGA